MCEERTNDDGEATAGEGTIVEELEDGDGIVGAEVDSDPFEALATLERGAVGEETGIPFVFVKIWIKVVVVVIVEKTRLGVGHTPSVGVMEGWGVVRMPVQCLHGGLGVGVNPGSGVVELAFMGMSVDVRAGGVKIDVMTDPGMVMMEVDPGMVVWIISPVWVISVVPAEMVLVIVVAVNTVV